MGTVSKATGQEVDKREQIGAKFKNNFPFLKKIYSVIIVIGYQLKPNECSFISI